LTLIELMIAFVIVGVIVAVAATGLREAFNVELKGASRELSALIRYLRSKAVTEHMYVRLALDLDESRYWVEESQEPYLISTDEPALGGVVKKEGKETEEGEDREASSFQKSEEKLAAPRKLGRGVLFKDVMFAYLPGKVEKGQVFVYFFPDGHATQGIINLKDEEEEDFFSLEILSLSGRVRVLGEYRELERP